MSDTEAPDVTFVGGIAVEQHESMDSNLEDSEREEAKEAVRKAIKEAGESSAESAKEGKAKDPYRPPGAKSDPKEAVEEGSEKVSAKKDQSDTPERGADGKFLPKDGSAKSPVKKEESEEETPLDVSKATVKELLKAREKVAAIKREAKDEISKERADFQRQQAEFQNQQRQFQQANEQLRRQYQNLQALKSDPARAIRELGMSPEDYIMELAQEGTPEGQAKRQYKELQSQLAEMKQWKADQERQVRRQRQQYQEQAIVNARKDAVEGFVKLGMDESKYPHVASFYNGQHRALVAYGDIAAEEYRSLSGGKEGSLPDILDYIEDQLAEKANAWYQNRYGSKAKTEPEVKESPSKSKSKGKSLSPDGSGERRALQPKSLKDLDGDERLEAAKQAVAIAMANSQ